MKRATIALLLLLASSAAAVAAPPSPMADLAWMTGTTWSAKTPGGGITHIDTAYKWASTGSFIQFDTKFVRADGTVDHGYSGMFFVDPKNGPSIWYSDSNNAIVTGTVTVNPNGMTMYLVDDGTHDRLDIVRTNPTSYRWELFAQQKDAWVKALQLEFVALQQ